MADKLHKRKGQAVDTLNLKGDCYRGPAGPRHLPIPWQWLIEPSIFPEAETARLITTLAALGSITHRFVEFITYPHSPEDLQYNLFAYGSTRHIQHLPQNIEIWYSSRRYAFSQTIPFFGRHALNCDFCLMPAMSIVDRCKYDRFFLNDKFIKADTGIKVMSTYANAGQFQSEVIEALVGRDLALMVVASTKTIYDEWRFWCTGTNVLAGVCYRRHFPNHKWNIVDKEQLTKYLGREILPKAPIANLDPIFVVDLCTTPDKKTSQARLVPKLLEINAFSTSGFYDLSESQLLVVLQTWQREMNKLVEKENDNA